VGALQANFGGPYDPAATAEIDAEREKLEAEMAALEDTLGSLDDPESEEARAVADQLAALAAALAATVAPADEPAWDGDWRTADLDITSDGIIDLADLEAARALGQTSTAQTPTEEIARSETTTGAAGAEPDGETSADTVVAVTP
jgi:hypothetical protein